MDYRIIHACGHEQEHYLTGYDSQQMRKAQWLATTQCRRCFVATKRAEQAEVEVRHGATIAHLDLPPLSGSERQVSWAATIRAARIAGIVGSAVGGALDEAYCTISDAKWWIDSRDLADPDLLARARQASLVEAGERVSPYGTGPASVRVVLESGPIDVSGAI